jgi:hypothetical protein
MSRSELLAVCGWVPVWPQLGRELPWLPEFIWKLKLIPLGYIYCYKDRRTLSDYEVTLGHLELSY